MKLVSQSLKYKTFYYKLVILAKQDVVSSTNWIIENKIVVIIDLRYFFKEIIMKD